MKKLSILLSLILCVMLITPALADDVIKIGAIAPLTGDVAQYGNAVKEGADLYVEEINAKGGINGKKVEIIWVDDKGDVNESTNAYNKLVDQDGVNAILGGVISKSSIAIADRSVEEGIPVISPSSTAVEVTEGKNNVFRSCFLDDFQAKALAKYSNESLGLKRIAIIYDNGDDFSIGIAESFKEQAIANGQEIVAYESGAASDVDFKAQLTNIKNANPDGLLVSFYYREASNIMKQSVEVGLDKITLLAADGMNGIENMFPDHTGDEILSRLYYTDHFASDADVEEIKNFNAAFEKKYGKPASSAFMATSYDAVAVLCNAFERAGTTNYEDVVQAMKETDLKCVTGQIKFDEGNNPIKSAFILSIQDGKEVFRAVQEP